MQETKKAIAELVKIKLTNSQTKALESFINDRGIAIFKNSSLLKAINRGDFDTAILEFGRWTIDAGRIKPELVELRQREIDLFTKTH